MTPCGATRVGTSHVPRASIRSIASASRKIPCSIERIPARTAFLIPSAPWAWAMTNIPAAVASATRTSSSSGEKWAWAGLSRAESTPPDVATLITSAPVPVQLADLAAHLVGSVDDARGQPGIRRGERHVDAGREPVVPWPPVWLSIAMLICMRGPTMRPSSNACCIPRSAPLASRTEVIPARRVRPRFFSAS